MPIVDHGRRLRVAQKLIDPRNWSNLVRRVPRNADFFISLIDYATGTEEQRSRALGDVFHHLRRRAFEGDAKSWVGDTKGMARTLLVQEEVVSRQLQLTSHFGAIKLSDIEVTRLDYVRLTNSYILRLKEEFSGYGLGAASEPLSSGSALSRLEVAQVWSILVNMGHLFGTFSTERALLYEMFRDSTLASRFVAAVAPELRPYATEIVQRKSLNEFFYALAAWRVSRLDLKQHSRADLVELLRRFFEERRSEQASQEMWAFRSARQLAYNAIHSYLSIGPPLDVVRSPATIRAMSPWRELSFESHAVQESSQLTQLLSAADAYLWENVFAGPEVAAGVLAHIGSFRAWWKEFTGTPEDAVEALFSSAPPGWSHREPAELHHFARIKIPRSGGEWLEEISGWLSQERWESANFLVSPRALRLDKNSDTGMNVDIYSKRGAPVAASEIQAICRCISSHSRQSWVNGGQAENRELWRSTTAFGIRMLETIVCDKHVPHLFPIRIGNEAEGRVGYSLLSDVGSALEHLTTLVNDVVNKDRAREIQATLEVARQVAGTSEGTFLLFFLGSVVLLRRLKRQEQVAEFDGVFCVVEKSQMRWFFIEHKKRESASSQLRKAATYLRHPVEEVHFAGEGLTGRVAIQSVVASSV